MLNLLQKYRIFSKMSCIKWHQFRSRIFSSHGSHVWVIGSREVRSTVGGVVSGGRMLM